MNLEFGTEYNGNKLVQEKRIGPFSIGQFISFIQKPKVLTLKRVLLVIFYLINKHHLPLVVRAQDALLLLLNYE